MNYKKFRIVEQNSRYALQGNKECDGNLYETKTVFLSRLGKKKQITVVTRQDKTYEWEFIEIQSITENNKEKLIEIIPIFFCWNISRKGIRVYTTLSAAQTALKKYFWDNLVEPLSENDWRLVDKNK